MTVNGASIYPIVKLAGVLGCSLRDVGQPNMAGPKMLGIGEFSHFSLPPSAKPRVRHPDEGPHTCLGAKSFA